MNFTSTDFITECLLTVMQKKELFSSGYGILGKGPNLTETAVPEMIPPSLFGWSDFRL